MNISLDQFQTWATCLRDSTRRGQSTAHISPKAVKTLILAGPDGDKELQVNYSSRHMMTGIGIGFHGGVTPEDVGVVASNPSEQDFTIPFLKLWELYSIPFIGVHNRDAAIQLIMDFPKGDTLLWIEAMKAGLSGRLYRDQAMLSTGIPLRADTMSEWTRLTNTQVLLERVMNSGVEGGFLEAGVWRGGMCIFARILLNIYGQHGRGVWVADSFGGLPPLSLPEDQLEAFLDANGAVLALLRVSRGEVEKRFRDWELGGLAGLGNVHFISGFFNESFARDLPSDTKLAIVRADGDMYESTLNILYSTYELLQLGGFLICDDCGQIAATRAAVLDFRGWHGISEPVANVDGVTWYWQKQVSVKLGREKIKMVNAGGRRLHFKRKDLQVAFQEDIRTMRESNCEIGAPVFSLNRLPRYWPDEPLRDELIAAASLLALEMYRCNNAQGKQRASDIMELLRLLLIGAGPSHSLVLVEDSLARLWFSEGGSRKRKAARGVAWRATAAFNGLQSSGGSWESAMQDRHRAFRLMRSVLHWNGLNDNSLGSELLFRPRCFAEWMRRTSAYNVTDMFKPQPIHQRFREMCNGGGFCYASIQFDVQKYIVVNSGSPSIRQHLQQLRAASQNSLYYWDWRIITSGIGICLPQVCMVDPVGLSNAILVYFTAMFVGSPMRLPQPRWGSELNVTFDPGNEFVV